METIKSAQRVCEIFEFFNEVRRPLMLKDIVSRFGYPASSCSVLLKSLVQLGFLEYDALHRAYLPTMRMSTLVEWVEKSRFGNGSVLSAMRRLHELTQETVCLGAQSDLHAQFIYQIAGVLPFPYPRLRQTVRPMEKSGLGWLLLSTLPDEQIEHLLKRIHYGVKPEAHRIDLAGLMEEVNRIRRDGYVFSRHTVVAGAGMIGMLIPPRTPDSRQLAISVHGPVDRLDEKQRTILRELAAVTTAAGILGV
jgi:IclR family KDG regulon transcriptional repressor